MFMFIVCLNRLKSHRENMLSKKCFHSHVRKEKAKKIIQNEPFIIINKDESSKKINPLKHGGYKNPYFKVL